MRCLMHYCNLLFCKTYLIEIILIVLILIFYFLQKGLKNVFDEAILAALEPPEPVKKRKCVIL